MEAKLKQRIKQIIREQVVTCGNKQIEDIDFETCGEDYAIFYKVGIKEVVEWVDENREYSNFNRLWQTKLKEWGIE